MGLVYFYFWFIFAKSSNLFFLLIRQGAELLRCWHVIRKVIWYVTKLRFFETLCNIYLFWSSCLCPVLAQFFYFEKKIGIGCVNIQKFIWKFIISSNSKDLFLWHASNINFVWFLNALFSTQICLFCWWF